MSATLIDHVPDTGIAARAFRSPLVPIVALTANAFDDDRQACLDAGMDDYLPKPVRQAALAAVLERVVARAADPARATAVH